MITLDVGSGDRSMPFGGTYLRLDKRSEVAPDVVADFRSLPNPDASLDTLYASHVLEHCTQEGGLEALREWCRCLKPGGKLLLTVPNLKWALLNLDVSEAMKVIYGKQDYSWNEHKWGYTPESILEAVESCGFEVTHQEIQYYQINIEARKA